MQLNAAVCICGQLYADAQVHNALLDHTRELIIQRGGRRSTFACLGEEEVTESEAAKKTQISLRSQNPIQ